MSCPELITGSGRETSAGSLIFAVALRFTSRTRVKSRGLESSPHRILRAEGAKSTAIIEKLIDQAHRSGSNEYLASSRLCPA